MTQHKQVKVTKVTDPDEREAMGLGGSKGGKQVVRVQHVTEAPLIRVGKTATPKEEALKAGAAAAAAIRKFDKAVDHAHGEFTLEDEQELDLIVARLSKRLEDTRTLYLERLSAQAREKALESLGKPNPQSYVPQGYVGENAKEWNQR